MFETRVRKVNLNILKYSTQITLVRIKFWHFLLQRKNRFMFVFCNHDKTIHCELSNFGINIILFENWHDNDAYISKELNTLSWKFEHFLHIHLEKATALH